jgi:hypothetical protein
MALRRRAVVLTAHAFAGALAGVEGQAPMRGTNEAA